MSKILNIHPVLATPTLVDGQHASEVRLDLTAYLVGPSEAELEYVLGMYERICPASHRSLYIDSGLQLWTEVNRPALTLSGQQAAAAGIPRPYFEAERKRLREGRKFLVGYSDGQKANTPDDGWSLQCAAIHRRKTGLHPFVRIVIPLNQDYKILEDAARALADNVEIRSGHGGLVFTHEPWVASGALDLIYAQARRFWGIEVEEILKTLPLMKEGIKSVNWITMVGRDFASRPEIHAALADLAKVPNVTIDQRKYATLLIAGPQPVQGDQHRPDNSLDPYYAVAKALEPLFIKAHPNFSSERWVKSGKAVGWIRRLLDPAGWR
jgi:Protein of unknown function (DUF3396)